MRSIITFLLICAATIASARQISPAEAQQIASDFFGANLSDVHKATHRILPSTEDQSALRPYYIFNSADDEGFVIVSSDTHTNSILGYSLTGSFDYENTPPQLKFLLRQYEQLISLIASTGENNGVNYPNSTDSQNILLSTADWGQGYPYNLSTPLIDGTHCPTGCVPTAMAIVMNYHHWPSNPRGQWSYNLAGFSHSVDFSQSLYEFSDFKSAYSENEDQTPALNNLAQMFYEIGVASCIGYKAEGSGTRLDIIGHILSRYFKYSPDCQYLMRKDFDSAAWEAMLLENLASGNPVIYGANDDNIGHAFVIDGVKDGLYHVNWGWDGAMNGYYALSALNPDLYDFDTNHSMVIKIEPDYNNTDVPDIWSNAGLFREYSQGIKPGEDDGRGIEISCADIEPGIPFSIISECLSGPCAFDGEIGIALTLNGEISQILSSKRCLPEIFPGDYFPYRNLTDHYHWENLICDAPVNPDAKLQLVTKRNGTDNWQTIHGTMQAPSSIPVSGNSPTVIQEHITYHGTSAEDNDVVYKSHLSRLGQNLSPDLLCYDGVGHVYIDGEYKFTSNEFNYNGIGYYPKSTCVNVDIYYKPFIDLTTRTIEINEPGSLASMLTNDDYLYLYKLSLTGQINDTDIETIHQLHGLGHLDLSKASYNGNNLQFSHLIILELPKGNYTICNIEETTIVRYPQSVLECGNGDFRSTNFVVLDTTTPPSITADRPEGVILIVPNGSRQDYENHPVWGKCHEIVEMDSEDYPTISYNITNGLVYFNLTSKICSLIDGTEFVSGGTVPMPVDYDDDYHQFNSRYLTIPSTLNIENEERSVSFIVNAHRYNKRDSFQGIDIFYLPENGVSAYGGRDWTGSFQMQYFCTSSLKNNFSHIAGFMIAPPHSECISHINPENQIYLSFEFFSLEKFVTENIIRIKPNLNGVSILSVKVNGLEVSPINGSYDYSFDYSDNPEVSVTYSYHDQNVMTTNYDSAFLEGIESSGVTEVNKDSTYKIYEIYDLNGVLQYKGSTPHTDFQRHGLFIIKECNRSYKLLL